MVFVVHLQVSARLYSEHLLPDMIATRTIIARGTVVGAPG